MSIVHEDFEIEEEGGGIAPGAIVATAVAAGLAAFMIRRATHRDKPVEPPPVEVATSAWERVSDPALRGRTVAATRDFVTDRVLPEMKPVLLDLVRDVKGYVDDAFRRIEQSIRNM